MLFERFVLPAVLLLLIVTAAIYGYEAALLAAILAMLGVIAVFIQRGFNQVIAGLASIDRRLSRPN